MANKMKTLQPGDKIYSLFEYKEVLIRGKAEQFLIKIEKVPSSLSVLIQEENGEAIFCSTRRRKAAYRQYAD